MRWIVLGALTALMCGQAMAETMPNSMFDEHGNLRNDHSPVTVTPLKGHVVCRNEGAYSAYYGGYNPVVRRCYMVP